MNDSEVKSFINFVYFFYTYVKDSTLQSYVLYINTLYINIITTELVEKQDLLFGRWSEWEHTHFPSRNTCT